MGTSFENKNPLIKRLLTSYRISSESSLSGPTDIKLETRLNVSNYSSSIRFDNERVKKELKNEDGFRQCATFMTMDTTFDGLTSTELEGETIACFQIGGECRLCLVQIIKSILSSFTLPEIHAVFESFHIFSAICSPIQLKCLKEKDIIPASATKGGLITKSDAQRFCSVLLRGGNLLTDKKRLISKEPFRRKRLSFVYERGDVKKSDCFGVSHKCFGGCRGTFVQKLYRSSHSACIQCEECLQLLSPEKFVSHFHFVAEHRQTCHWGFDSANWRNYLELDPRELPEHRDTLLKIKRFKDSNCSLEPEENVARTVQVQTSSFPAVLKSLKSSLPFDGSYQEPPPLLHPMMSCRPDMESFAPNVCLKPATDQMTEFAWKEPFEEKVLLKYERRNEIDDDDDDDDDDDEYNGYKEEVEDDDDEVKCHVRRNKVLASITDEDVLAIQQLDEIQEAERKLFKMALSEETSDKNKLMNEFCLIQKKLQSLLEGLVSQNKHLTQKYSDCSDEKETKDSTTFSGVRSNNLEGPHAPYKKRHCRTVSPVRESKFPHRTPESDSDDSEDGSEEPSVGRPTSQRPPKRKRCNTYSTTQQMPIKMELC